MNIFFLALLVSECARAHCDRHVIKMILESTQLLFSAWHLTAKTGWQNLFPENVKIYRLTHKNHPMSIWTRKSIHNYRWLVSLAYELALEYDRRYRCRCTDGKYECQKCPSKRPHFGGH